MEKGGGVRMAMSTIDAVNAYYDSLEWYIGEEQKKEVLRLRQEFQDTKDRITNRQSRLEEQTDEITELENRVSLLNDENAKLEAELVQCRNRHLSMNRT